MDERQKEFLKKMIEEIEEALEDQEEPTKEEHRRTNVDRSELIDRVVFYNDKGQAIDCIDDIKNMMYFIETSETRVLARYQLTSGPGLMVYAHGSIKEQLNQMVDKSGGPEGILRSILNEMKEDLNNA